MTSPATIDLDRLAAPVNEEMPAGRYLREVDYDRLQRVKDERALAMSRERKQRELLSYSEEDLEMIPEEDRKLEPPNWKRVRDLCVEILSEHSKDLWVASWLIEANTRIAGFAGLRDGFQLATVLVQQYWETLYPPPDEDEGYLGTVSQLASLNGEEGPGTLLYPIRTLTLVPGEREMSLATYVQATEGTGAAHTEAEFLARSRQLDPDQLRSHAEDIEEAIQAYEDLNSCLQEKCDNIAPPSSQIAGLLRECARVFRLITRDILTADAADEGSQVGSEDTVVLVPAGNANAAGMAQVDLNSREDAFRMLLRASEFFRKTEPHSPVSYMLQQAVRYGRMDLPDLLQELIPDESVLTHFAERTGVQIKSDSDDD